MSEQLIASFAALVHQLDAETSILKELSQASNQVTEDGVRQLQYIEELTTLLEAQMDAFEQTIETDYKHLQDLQAYTAGILQQSLVIHAYVDKLPVETTTAPVGNKQDTIPPEDKENISNGVSTHKQIGDEECYTTEIAADEFEAISKSTRGRLTLQQTNDYLALLVKMVGEKKKVVLKKDRRKMSAAELKSFDSYMSLLNKSLHGKDMFLSETEIRACVIFKSDSNGKAVLHTLRSLNRIKLIRAGSENTYILV